MSSGLFPEVQIVLKIDACLGSVIGIVLPSVVCNATLYRDLKIVDFESGFLGC